MVKVLIADSTRIFRESLKHLIEQDSELTVVGHAENGLQAVDSCGTLAPEVVIMDVVMPGCDGIKATRRIESKFHDSKVLILTNQTDTENVASALKSGVDGYVFKDIKGCELILAVKCVASNLKIFHPNAFDGMGLCIQTSGKSNKEIAGLFHLSEGRIKNIITGILKKNNLHDRTQLALYAIENLCM
ncbi:response regulator transcription factor [Tumebacillus flagellatus]|uniref:Response regulatory domain-containing protein n=1 Tax=Tumebacillus flagellatus TaxID=1157490 RepID=A0A074LVD9_9BACL|nr:response regulator transcription factor [Tumebacillus flagellatus]KEO84949.1 hypothetical protein EL26_02805 [Tumebacillus flagellatus]